MHVLILGGSGFVGSHIAGKLLKKGYKVDIGCRSVRETKRRFPEATVKYVNYNHMTQKENWLPVIDGYNVVINAVGVFEGSTINSIQADAPIALAQACALKKTIRFIHISAFLPENTNTTYGDTKKKAEEAIKLIPDFDMTILRPSIIYGEGFSYGGAVIRAIAATPLVLPLVGKGEQTYQPVHIDDFTEVVLRACEYQGKLNQVEDIISEDIVTLKDLLIKTRHWLGMPYLFTVKIPMLFMYFFGIIGSILGHKRFNLTSFRLLKNYSSKSTNGTVQIFNYKLMNFDKGLQYSPSSVQSVWHAKLFYWKPILLTTLALVFLYLGLFEIISCYCGGDINSLVNFTIGLVNFFAGILLFVGVLVVPTLCLQVLLSICMVVYTLFCTPEMWLAANLPMGRYLLVPLISIFLISIQKE